MAINAGTVAAMLTLETGNFTSALQRAKSNLQEFVKEGNTVQQKMKALGTAMTDVGTKMVKSITLPLTALATASIKFASDAEETNQKFEAVFKELAYDVNTWAEAFATGIGRSKTEIRDFLATMQNTLVPLGMTRRKAADLSKTIVQLGLDLAAFNNESESDAINSLQSALVGNHMAMRKYGIIINETLIKQTALNMGFRNSVDELTEEQKALVRLEIIMNATKDAQGIAAKEANNFAGRVKAVTSLAKEAGEQIGEVLLPPIADLLGTIKSGLQWFTSLNENTKKVIVSFGAFAAGAGVALTVVGKLLIFTANFSKAINLLTAAKTAENAVNNIGIITKAKELIALGAAKIAKLADIVVTNLATAAQWLFNTAVAAFPYLLIVVGIAAIIAAAYLLIKNWDQVSAWLLKCWDGIKKGAEYVGKGIEYFFKLHLYAVLKIVDIVYNSIAKTLNFGINMINMVINSVSTLLSVLTGREVKFKGIGTIEYIDTASSVKFPEFANGGIVNKAMYALVGEGGESEAITPISKLMGMIQTSMTSVLSTKQGQNAISNVSNKNSSVYNINVTIPAKDLKEMQSINDFFNRMQPTARSMA
jgi:hypothetical protein